MPASRLHNFAHGLWLGALWTAGSLILCLLLAGAAPLALGDHSYVVRSGSMTPAIETGDVVVAQPIDPLSARVGQIVTFNDPDASGRLLSDQVSFVTQGDANTGQEQWSVPVDGQIGQVQYRIPKIGLALVWTQLPAARIGLIAIPALLLVVFALSRIWRAPRERGSGVRRA